MQCAALHAFILKDGAAVVDYERPLHVFRRRSLHGHFFSGDEQMVAVGEDEELEEKRGREIEVGFNTLHPLTAALHCAKHLTPGAAGVD